MDLFPYSLVVRCGGVFNESTETIESENYPNNYPRNQQCVYKIQVEENHVVLLKFETFETEENFDFVTVCIIIYVYVCVYGLYVKQVENVTRRFR